MIHRWGYRENDLEGEVPKQHHGYNAVGFSDNDLGTIRLPYEDPIIVPTIIANCYIQRILIDNGSSTDVLMYDAFVRMGLTLSQLRKSLIPLTDFGGSQVKVKGEITLPVTLRMEPHQQTFLINFVVVRIPSPYKAILGRLALNNFQAAVSTYLLLVRFPTQNGVGEVRRDQRVAKQCLVIQDKQSDGSNLALDQLDPWDKMSNFGESVKRMVFVPLREDDPTKFIQIRSLLDEETKGRLIDFLQSNADIFAWSTSNMPSIPPEVMAHHLNVSSTYEPIR